jgi:hypothetical protein
MSEGLASNEQPQGRLGDVIATRGGLAPPEAPFVIEHREALIYILCQAAELEHGIMAQYLFAAFSLKQSTAEDLSDAEAAPCSAGVGRSCTSPRRRYCTLPWCRTCCPRSAPRRT